MKSTGMIQAFLQFWKLFFHKVSVIFNTLLPTLRKTLYTNVVKFPAATSEHITSGTKKLWANRDKASEAFILTERWKTSFSLTTMPGHTLVWAHARKLQNSNTLFFLILLTAQIWYPPTASSLAPYRTHQVEAVLQMTTSWNKITVMCS
jgi:hypothetical protein